MVRRPGGAGVLDLPLAFVWWALLGFRVRVRTQSSWKGTASAVLQQGAIMGLITPEGIFLSCIRNFRGWKKRTSAAKAGYRGVIYGTAEAVPFLQDRVLTQALKPLRASFNQRLKII